MVDVRNPIASYRYNNRAQRWTNVSTGRFVSERNVVAEMRRHQEATFGELEALTNALYEGRISVSQWQTSTASVVKDGHLAQSMFAVGGKDNMTPENYGRVGGTLRNEYTYLSQFAQDIADGKQTQAQAQARIRQYGQAVQQSYWREYSNATGGLIRWKLNPADHCDDCVRLAKNSPYTADTLPTYPGAGQTECRGNCKCELERM